MLFRSRLELPGPGTYEIDGHVQRNHSAPSFDAPVDCRITRDRPGALLDRQTTTILKADIFNVGVIDEGALTTVEAPASSGPGIALPAPVTVAFTCRAQRPPTSKATNTRIVFHDWTLSATPVKVYTVQKPK